MYAKRRCKDEARELLGRMPQNLSWYVTIAGYAENGFVEKALETFKQMQSTGVSTLATVLTGCAEMGALEQVMRFICRSCDYPGYEQSGFVYKDL
ncbi:pentatricopeptide repeat-containing protein At1g08070, chloroplastic-like [Cryptomeria japonica]|uniref:pentatricopeptide repeat-containing protein At1g08070, chloroplastic-like n=1 Tax=Cryptomeria japonica TaxID=3369 RepID=UPI0025ACE027|nr:pentatricopeptide repeat-containing protein At1g08070, chloroplastic-like [Cryptomeria japonica]